MPGFLQRFKIPHVFTLLTGVVFGCSLLTFVIPSGEYERETRSVGGHDRTVVVPDTYTTLPKHYSGKGLLVQDEVAGQASPVSLEGFLSAIPRGMVEAADIIFFIFIIGGVFGILQATGTIPAVLGSVLNRLRSSWRLLTIVLMTAIGIGGSTLGMGEEFIPLVPIFLIVAKEIGCDRIFGVALVYVAGAVGFAAATTNPFTVNIAQEIAGLPLNSAISFRLLFFVACMTVTLVYMLRYGSRIRRDPSMSFMAGDDFELPGDDVDPPALRTAHVVILVACIAIFVFILYAVQEMGWWLTQMAGGFILMGLVATAVARLPVREATRAAVRGMEEMTVAALVVGFARGITVVLEEGQILDTLIFSAAAVLQHVPRYVAAEGMLVFQAILNFFIPSGSGQAAVTMPLMAPLADVLGLTRQTAVFAFTCGDGFSNTVIPTSGILMASLGLAHVPYDRWLRFMAPLLLQLLVLAAAFMAIAVAIKL
ncbi:MAG: putative basic amino acid antiporter YfcC [Acidobacteria bacterium]|nr:putative basic amino acid antiporter YfcC [Candidatus Sulfomarinibacter sp. MAG AM1]